MTTHGFYKEVAPEDLARDMSIGLSEPVLCRDGAQIPGQSMPPAHSVPSDFVDVIGADRLVTVLQNTEEREIILPFGEWVAYLDDTNARAASEQKELNMVSFDVRQTALTDLVELPDFWRDQDLIRMLNEDLHDNGPHMGSHNPPNTALLGYDGGAAHSAATWRLEIAAETNFQSTIGFAQRLSQQDNSKPREPTAPQQTPLFCTMCTSGCYSDFFIPYGGAASYFYVASGSMWIYLVEPTPTNLQKYEQWVATGNMKFKFFGDLVERHEKMELETGASAYIPPGWIIGTFCPNDAIVFGSNILTPKTLPTHLDTYAMERRLDVPLRFRYPGFEAIMFQVIMWLRDRVKSSNLADDLETSQHQADDYMFLLRSILLWVREYDYTSQYSPLWQLEQELYFSPELRSALQQLDSNLHFSPMGQINDESREAIFVRSWKSAVTRANSTNNAGNNHNNISNNQGESNTAASPLALPQRSPPEPSTIDLVRAKASLLNGDYESIKHLIRSNSSGNYANNPQAAAAAAAAAAATAAGGGAGYFPTSQNSQHSAVSPTIPPAYILPAGAAPRPDDMIAMAQQGGAAGLHRVNEQLQCDKCLGYFSKKGLGPHRRYCKGEMKKDYSLHRPKINIGADGSESVKVQSATHRSSCHRCGNLRKKVVLCPRCPNIYCRKCSEKMREEHGPDVFETGCPFCKSLCCCHGERTRSCPRKYHCYKKCPVSLAPVS